MYEAGSDENGRQQIRTRAERTEQVAGSILETQLQRRKVVGCLLQIYTLQLTLFGLLALFVHVHPILPLDVAITRYFQQNQTPWLRITMLAISYPGNSLLLPALVLLPAPFKLLTLGSERSRLTKKKFHVSSNAFFHAFQLSCDCTTLHHC